MRSNRWFVSLSALVFSVSAVACTADAGIDEADEGIESSSDSSESALSKTVRIGQADAGKTIVANVGDSVVLSLPSNPSTGFSWAVTATTRTLGYPTTRFVRGSSNAVGSGGTAKFTWKTANLLSPAGLHRVTVAYRRPWETNVAPAQTFTFTLKLVAPPAPTTAVILDESADQTTVDVQKGQDVVVRLPSNPSTGFGWEVLSTNRTFGYPKTSTFEATPSSGPIVGSGGTEVFTWSTLSPLPMSGSHTVTLGYRRSWETNVPPAKTFTFTVDIAN